jgi:hypothetical protein
MNKIQILEKPPSVSRYHFGGSLAEVTMYAQECKNSRSKQQITFKEKPLNVD